MSVKRIAHNTRGEGRRVGIVVSRFNPRVGEALLGGALKALGESGVVERDVLVVTVPGALETPLALQRLAQSDDFDALVALGAVIRGETYHFEIVAEQSASGITGVQLEFGVPIGNGILTTENEVQALDRAATKGYEAAQAALELANLLVAIDDLE